MSTESAKEFVSRMMDDKSFADSVEKSAGKEERIAFIKQEGFDFTREELISAAAELNTLDAVGGKCCGHTAEHVPYCDDGDRG